MPNELRRATRYPLTAVAEIVDLSTDVRINAQTSDLSLVGCYIDTLNPLPTGTKVSISITHESKTVATEGAVVYSMANMGMGIEFLQLGQNHLIVLRQWLNKFGRNEPDDQSAHE